MPLSAYSLEAEWLETDGLGGFATGTVSGIRSRCYHALLVTATRPPGGRVVLVNGFDAWLETPAGRYALSAQHYAPGIVNPQGHQRIVTFAPHPWPRWGYRCEDGTELSQEMLLHHDNGEALLRWHLSEGDPPVKLTVRPFLSVRNYHALHRQNPRFDFTPTCSESSVLWRPYRDRPAVIAFSNGAYQHEPLWYYDFLYQEECNRGLDPREDLAAPGIFTWELGQGQEAVLIFRAEAGEPAALPAGIFPGAYAAVVREREQRRRNRFSSLLRQAADSYIVRRNAGRSIIAGYPWFTDWGRDTFIALRGLCLATGRLDIARDILTAWAGTISQGMLPNRFPDSGQTPEYNAVDASLWYIVAVHEYLQSVRASSLALPDDSERRLKQSVEAILSGYSRGTRFAIRMDSDGLLAAGEPGLQLTWMDARVGDWVVTPRIGKPVEVQALWLNALRIGETIAPAWREPLQRGLEAFRSRFWNADAECLYDVIDVDHIPGKTDASLRPNQILAVGGLPYPLMTDLQAERIVATVEKRLLTPLGLRTLAPGDPHYQGVYRGSVAERDAAYHQGTVWPWLMGPFVEAWLRLRDFSPAARREAQQRFLAPLLAHLQEAGLGHVSEIADGDPPHTPRGCPFQAWSLGELLRLRQWIEQA